MNHLTAPSPIRHLLVIAISFGSTVAYAQPGIRAAPTVTSAQRAKTAPGWKKPKADELALRQAHADATAQHALLEPQLIAADAEHRTAAQTLHTLTAQHSAFLSAAAGRAKYPLLPWQRDKLSREQWEARNQGWREQAAALEPRIATAKSAVVGARSKMWTLGAEMNRLKEHTETLDGQIFEAALARAPRELSTRYAEAQGKEHAARNWSAATFQELRDFNARQHPEPSYYDFEGRQVVNEHMETAGKAARKAAAGVEAVKQEIRAGAAP